MVFWHAMYMTLISLIISQLHSHVSLPCMCMQLGALHASCNNEIFIYHVTEIFNLEHGLSSHKGPRRLSLVT